MALVNLHNVVGMIWRSGRPEPDDYAIVKLLYKSVLTLEGSAEDKRERDALAPLPVFSLPIGFVEIYFTGVSQTKLANALHIIDIAPKPLLIHCQHGRDRTGLIVAAYRVRYQGWSKEEAMQEARDLGYRRWLNWGLNRTWARWSGGI